MRAGDQGARRDDPRRMRPGQGARRTVQAHRSRTHRPRAARSRDSGRGERNARMTAKIEGQAALVTGASRGIGAAIAHELAQLGVKVIGTATTPDGAAKVTQALSGFQGCKGAVLNVNDAAAAEALVDSITKEYGGLQILVNKAGITRDMLAMRL